MFDTVAIPALLLWVILVLLLVSSVTAVLFGCSCQELETRLKKTSHAQEQMNRIVFDTRNALNQAAAHYTQQVLSGLDFANSPGNKPSAISQRRPPIQ